MAHWWELAAQEKQAGPPRPRAVAYYRHSAQDRQVNSIPIQQEQVRKWAEENGVDIIEEFDDTKLVRSDSRPHLTTRVATTGVDGC